MSYYDLDSAARRAISECGNEAARHALQALRQRTLESRLRGLQFAPDFAQGSSVGQLRVAELDMRADPLAVMAARNEIRFLMGMTR